MSIADRRKRRQVIPRWRPWWVTARLGLAETGASVRSIGHPNTTTIDRRREEWLENHDLPHAADLISTAFGMGLGERAQDAAEFVLEAKRSLPQSLLLLAKIIVDGDADLPASPVDIDHVGRHVRINSLKGRLKNWPHDAIARIDLAREYATLGQRSKALKPISVALALAPHNPFVIRSAARFFLNHGEPERALAVVRRTPRVLSDPWLLAAEIATASAAETSSRHVRLARSIITRGLFAPRHVSELASALATIELESGNRRGARKLFAVALQNPTENAVAQAQWASSTSQDLNLEIGECMLDRSYEAVALINFGKGAWAAAVESAKLWLMDEPFATSSAYFGSWTASVVSTDFSAALQFAEFGLSTKPNDSLLLNNKTVALALLDRHEEAAITLRKIDPVGAAEKSEATYWATCGLVSYRLGCPEKGRAFYQRARAVARKSGNAREEAWAILFEAREERRFDRERALKLLTEAPVVIRRMWHRDVPVADRLLEVVSQSVRNDPAASVQNSLVEEPSIR